MLAMNDDVGAWRLLEGIVGPASTEAEVAYLRGVTHHRRGEIEAALVQLRAAVAGDPRQIEAHLLLARIYYGRSDRAQASAHVNQALAIDPANREAVVLKQQDRGLVVKPKVIAREPPPGRSEAGKKMITIVQYPKRRGRSDSGCNGLRWSMHTLLAFGMRYVLTIRTALWTGGCRVCRC
jgi:tetratricopeptide (TPR) repeat protein